MNRSKAVLALTLGMAVTTIAIAGVGCVPADTANLASPPPASVPAPTQIVTPTPVLTPVAEATATSASTPTPLPTSTLAPASPLDGSLVALVEQTYQPPEQYGSNVIVLHEVQRALQQIVLIDAESPSWSSDGRSLLLSQHGAIVLVDAATWQTRTMSYPAQGESDHWPRWSPDGQWISFVRARGSDPRRYYYPGQWPELSLWTMRPDGLQVRQLAPAWQPTGTVLAPSWSPDSTSLAYPGRLEWGFVDAVSGQPIPVALAPGEGPWPDGQLMGSRILWAPNSAAGVNVVDYENGRCAYFVYLSFFDVHAGRVTKVVGVPMSAGLHWLADGSELRFDAPANFERGLGGCSTETPGPPRTISVRRDGSQIRVLPLEGTATPTTKDVPIVRIDTIGVRLVLPDGAERWPLRFSPEFHLLNAFCLYCQPAVAFSAHRARVLFVAGQHSLQAVRGGLWSVEVQTGQLEKLTRDLDILEFVPYP